MKENASVTYAEWRKSVAAAAVQAILIAFTIIALPALSFWITQACAIVYAVTDPVPGRLHTPEGHVLLSTPRVPDVCMSWLFQRVPFPSDQDMDGHCVGRLGGLCRRRSVGISVIHPHLMGFLACAL